jgi:hypothetical protein
MWSTNDYSRKDARGRYAAPVASSKAGFLERGTPMIRSSLTPLALVLPLLCFQAVAAEESVVPVERAPFHVPAFKNEYVTMLNVYIPPGRTTGYHKHSMDYVSCWVEEAQIRNQVLGLDPIEPKKT